jgi:hypothetical protein
VRNPAIVGIIRNKLRRIRGAIAFPSSYLCQREIIRKHGLPSSILFFDGGIGDQLLLTCVARHLRQRGERRIWIASQSPELFAGNADISHVLPGHPDDYSWLVKRHGVVLHVLKYASHIRSEGRDIPPEKHMLAIMCEQAGIAGPVDLRPYLHLAESEYLHGKKVDRQVAIQSSGRSARYFMSTKEWFPERFQEVVDRLKSQVNFVQIGQAGDPPLSGVIDLRGRTTLRETAAVLAASELFVGLIGFPMHLARAVDCPAVIIYGGRELPSQSGYSCNINITKHNITKHTDCAPCWRWTDCPGQRSCMDQIKVDEVCEAILTRLAQGIRTKSG